MFMANRFGTVSDEMKNIRKYVKNIESRPAFQKAIQLGTENSDPLG